MTQPDILGDPSFPRLKSLILARTGLAYYADKDQALADRVGRRLAEVPQTVGAYLARLQSEDVKGPEFQALVNELAVGETFFFRYIEQFEALRVVAIPEALRRNRETRTLRIWSAGCSIGAEAYTLEILLKRHFAEQLAGWQVTILGTDLNHAFLEQARRGVYGEWTVRGLPEATRAACFDQQKGPQGSLWAVKPEFREWTRFDVFNLADGRLPNYTQGITSFDAVLCRNVMIYFDDVTRARLLAGLRDVLVDGGWLVVGHAETGPEMNAAFTPVAVPGATLYRKHDRPEPVPVFVPLPAMPEPVAAKPRVRPPVPEPEPASPPAPAPGMAIPEAASEQPSLSRVAALAAQGDRTAALEACIALVERDGLNASAHFHLGLLQEDLGVGDPIGAFRSALYLEPCLVLADYHLGLGFLRRGKLGAAQRHFRNVRNGLANRGDDDAVREGEGLTVRELRSMVALWLSGDETT